MKYIKLLLLFLFPLLSNAQSTYDHFAAYGNTSGISLVSADTFNFTITGFSGNARPYGASSFARADVLVGDKIFLNCNQYVIRNITSTAPNLVGTLYKIDNTTNNPTNSQTVAIIREYTNAQGLISYALPPAADGNGGVLSGINISLAACIQAHYSRKDSLAISNAIGGVIYKYLGGTGVSPAVNALIAGSTTAQNTVGQIYTWNPSSNLVTGAWSLQGGGSGTTETATNGLNKVGNDIRLGGALIGGTSITGGGVNGLSITGLSTGIVSATQGTTTSIIQLDTTTASITMLRSSNTQGGGLGITKDSVYYEQGAGANRHNLTLSQTGVFLGGITNANSSTTDSILVVGATGAIKKRNNNTVVNSNAPTVVAASVPATAGVQTDSLLTLNTATGDIRKTSLATVQGTASNGLTKNSGNVDVLGGTLTSATTITTDATNTLAIAGLQGVGGVKTDSIAVIDNTTGKLKKRDVETIGKDIFYQSTAPSDTTKIWKNPLAADGTTTDFIYKRGQWKPIKGYVSVLDFGAKGDGLKNNTLEFKAAHDYAYSNGIYIVYIPTGTYILDSFRIEAEMIIRGESKMTTVLKTSAVANTQFISDKGNAAKIHIEHLTVAGDSVTARDGIVLGFNVVPFGTEGRLENIFIRDFNGIGLKVNCNVGLFNEVTILNSNRFVYQIGNVAFFNNLICSGQIGTANNYPIFFSNASVSKLEIEAPLTSTYPLIYIYRESDIKDLSISLATSTTITTMCEIESTEDFSLCGITYYLNGSTLSNALRKGAYYVTQKTDCYTSTAMNIAPTTTTGDMLRIGAVNGNDFGANVSIAMQNGTGVLGSKAGLPNDNNRIFALLRDDTNGAGLYLYNNSSVSNVVLRGNAKSYIKGGFFGLNNTTPSYWLDIDANTGSAGNPMRLQGLLAGSTSDSIVSSSVGVLKRLSIAQIAQAATYNVSAGTAATDNLTATDNIKYYQSGSSTTTINFPSVSANSGKIYTLSSKKATIALTATSGTVTDIAGTTVTAILAGVSANFISDGTNWIMYQMGTN